MIKDLPTEKLVLQRRKDLVDKLVFEGHVDSPALKQAMEDMFRQSNRVQKMKQELNLGR